VSHRRLGKALTVKVVKARAISPVQRMAFFHTESTIEYSIEHCQRWGSRNFDS
jgi:hypothetical protein